MAETNLIEDRIAELLKDGKKTDALDFTAFLRANGITPEAHESGDGWSVIYSGESIGFIVLNGNGDFPGPWTVWLNSCEFGDGEGVSDKVKEDAWSHASICGHFESGGKNCGCGDQPGFTRTIFGKAYENRCHSPLMFHDPDASTLESVKDLFLMLKRSNIERNKAV